MKEFIKNKQNILIPVFLLIVLLIAIILYANEYKINRYANIEEVEVYQYFSGIKSEYTAIIGRNKKNVILDYENKDYVVSLDSTPVYIKDTNNVIFPKEMSIVFPLNDMQYRINALSEVYMENDLYFLNIRDLNTSYDHVFYYDGKNMYFFVDNVTLTIGDKKIELSPLSYVNAAYMSYVEYYDRESDVSEIIEITNEKVLVSNEYMSIEVTNDKVIYQDGFSLLTGDFGILTKITDMKQ